MQSNILWSSVSQRVVQKHVDGTDWILFGSRYGGHLELWTFFLSSDFQDSVFRYGSPSEIMTALQ